MKQPGNDKRKATMTPAEIVDCKKAILFDLFHTLTGSETASFPSTPILTKSSAIVFDAAMIQDSRAFAIAAFFQDW